MPLGDAIPKFFALGLAALGVSACATGMFTRETVTLDSARLEDYSIRYEPLPGCLLKQQVPTRYSVKRASYRLELIVKAGYNDEPPRIDVEVGDTSNLTLEFPGLSGALPETAQFDRGRRYTLNVANLASRTLTIDVRSGGEHLGQEAFTLHSQRCHGLSFQGV